MLGRPKSLLLSAGLGLLSDAFAGSKHATPLRPAAHLQRATPDSPRQTPFAAPPHTAPVAALREHSSAQPARARTSAVYDPGAAPWPQRTTCGRATSAHSIVTTLERPPSPPLKDSITPVAIAATERVAEAPSP